MKYMILLTVLLTSGAFASEYDDMLALAKQGDAASQRNLGAFYESGDGVEQDFDKAFSWYAKAAIQGDAVSAWKLGDFYSKGLEFAVSAHGSNTWRDISNYTEVGKNLQRIADGNPLSILSTVLSVEEVVATLVQCSTLDPDHYINAYKWYKISVINDPNKKFTRRANLLASVMSKEQRATSVELASLCAVSDYQDCSLDDYNATNDQAHSINTTVFNKSTKWKASECSQGDQLIAKYLSADSGNVAQTFRKNGDLISESAKTENQWIWRSFYDDGQVSAEDIYRKIPEKVRSKLKDKSAIWERVSYATYNLDGGFIEKLKMAPIEEPKRGKRKNELYQNKSSVEYYNDLGQLKRIVFYKGKRTSYTEYYNSDGTLRRTKKR
jgi:TPR repeat protein